MINVSNFTSESKSPGGPAPPGPQTGAAQLTRPAAISRGTAAERARTRSPGARTGNVLVITAGVLASWLAHIRRRLGDRLFAMNDNEAYWRGWQIAKVHGGLGRRYRGPLFDALAECAKCHGAGASTNAPCAPCLGTGRTTIGEVS